MLGSSQFIGWMVGSMILPRIGDLYGRKMPFIISVLAACILYILVFFATTLSQMTWIFFFTGITQAGKFSMAHVYLQELMP
jgi:MFS family permease